MAASESPEAPNGHGETLSSYPAGALTHQLLLLYYGSMTTNTGKSLPTVARIFHALSEETRLQILEHLKEGEQCVCDLTGVFKTGQSRLSFHLRVLKEAGLILARPEGRWVYYSLNANAVEELQEVVNSLKASSYRAAKRGCCP